MADPDRDVFCLDELPALGPDEPFRFACHPQVPCFNACCRDLDLELHPYDMLRLRQRLGLSSRAFLDRHGRAGILPHTGFPTVELCMSEAPERPCPFVRPEGCSVYEDRPAACRCYPVGRGVGLDADGERFERLFLLREAHCRGFEQPQRWTARGWLADQGLEPYAALDDGYMELMTRWGRRGEPLGAERERLVGLAVYQVDRFGAFLAEHQILDGLRLTTAEREAIESEEHARLRFALSWLELVLLDAGPLERAP